MRATINDLLRGLISGFVRGGGALWEIAHRLRVRRFRATQRRLRARFGIHAASPMTHEVPPCDQDSSSTVSGGTQVVQTSGTSGRPKQILYTRSRLRAVRWLFIATFSRCFWMLGIRRTSLYVFGSLTPDESLSSLLLTDKRQASYLTTLQAPYRIQRHTAFNRLQEVYGTAAVRLWILAVANPGVLYSTNPSTLSTFFDELEADWTRSSRLVGDCVRDPRTVDPEALAVVRRLASRGWTQRLRRIAASARSLSISEWAPAVRSYVCWTGGYVAPFLERLEEHLPCPRFRRIPMYSMATEAVETIPDFRFGDISFLPLAPGTYYEFLDAGAAERQEQLLPVEQLREGAVYEMVVSHRFGLRRYRTGDLFRVERVLAGLPDLRFLRRRGLAYSFTGEKLTGEQLAEAYETLHSEYGPSIADYILTCFPSQNPSQASPHYRLVTIRCAGTAQTVPPNLAQRLDALLGEMNLEYRSKRRSRRLGNVQLEQVGLSEFRRRVSRAGLGDWDAQFKFLPLYPRLWESLQLD